MFLKAKLYWIYCFLVRYGVPTALIIFFSKVIPRCLGTLLAIVNTEIESCMFESL